MSIERKELEQGIADLRAGMQIDALAHLTEALKWLTRTEEALAKDRVVKQESSEEEYWKCVESLARDAFGEKDKEEFLADRGGSIGWTCFPPNAYKVLQYSNYPDAIFSEGAHASCSSFNELVTLAAYYAMLEDVRGHLSINRPVWEQEAEQ